MVELSKENPEGKIQIPEEVRSRLDNLAKKIEEESKNLKETCLLRDAEVKALQTELTKRESAWQMEKNRLEQEVANLKNGSAMFQNKEREWNETQATLKNERKKWESKTQLYYKEELERLQKQLKDKESEWSSEKLAMEQSARKIAKEIADLKKEYQWNIQESEKQHQQKMTNAVDEFERLLDEARASWRGKMEHRKSEV